MARLLLIFTGIVLLVGCTDVAVLPTDPASIHAYPYSALETDALTTSHLNVHWAILARDHIPGWAGCYHRDGRSVILLKGSVGASLASEYVRERRSALNMVANAIEFKSVVYDFLELWEFYVEVWAVTVENSDWRPHIDYLGIDEVKNRVNVALTSPEVTSDVTAALIDRGIPETAFSVTSVVPSGPRQGLLDTFDRRPGGVRIKAEDAPSGCVLWLSFRVGGEAAFGSASHCSTQPFEPDTGEWFQNGSGPRIGVEAWDFKGYTGYNSPGGGLPATVCPEYCRYSDFQYGLYDDSTNALHGRIARTKFAGHLSSGSRDLDSAAPYWGVYDRLDMSYQAVGLWLSKVGATTGWTRGQITHTCIDKVSPTSPYGTILLCHHRTDIYSMPADSGSPIFYEGGTGSGGSPWDWVYLAGVLQGGPQGVWDVTDFGTVQGIDEDLPISIDVQLACAQGVDSIYPCVLPSPPDSLDVTIHGPDEVPPEDTCYYYASVTGGNGNYSYVWRKNGLPVGWSSDVNVSTGTSSFTLSLSVEDSADAVGSDELSVQVNSQALECFH